MGGRLDIATGIHRTDDNNVKGGQYVNNPFAAAPAPPLARRRSSFRGALPTVDTKTVSFA
jgi:hypothetical protein